MYLPLDAFFDGKWLARFRAWLGQQPPRGPDEIGAWHKAGRLALAFAVVCLVIVPALWLAFR